MIRIPFQPDKPSIIVRQTSSSAGCLRRSISCLAVLVAIFLPRTAPSAVVISEIHYNPVEESVFDANGFPVLDLYEDVHEFIELHNAGTAAVSLANWSLTGGIEYDFPTNTVIQAGQYLVVAKNNARLAAVPAYGLVESQIHGPYRGQLSNNGETVRLRNAQGEVVDSVSYSDGFPWAISADAFGAGPDFTGIDPRQHQYRGRSLERVSFTHPSNDPANWIASPFPGNPSPGRANAVQRAAPKPVVIHFSVLQAADEAFLIRQNQPVQIDAVFSAANNLSQVRIEWFVEDINVTTEPRATNSMAIDGPAASARFTAVLPGQPDRRVVRYRLRADRGDGDEVVSPRADDPFQWHAYFVTPVRTSSRPVYDVFISSASLSRLSSNISQNPRRVTSPDPPGYPRESWNANEPAIFVHEGVVYEMRMRHHGSRYNRSANRNSLKFQFPRYKLFNGYQGIFETDKGNLFVAGHGIFDAAGLPTSRVRYVDLYLNSNLLTRLEQEEMDDRLAERYHREQALANPGTPVEEPGEFYKSTGTIQALNFDGEGPYGVGDARRLNPKSVWTPLDRYQWTYGIQSAEWKGAIYLKQMIDGLWAARGDTHTAPNPNIPAVRAYLEQTFDVEETLAYLAIINWMGPWDETTQNYFFWQRRNGRWGMLPWDFDAMFGGGDNAPASASIYMGENGDRNNNFRGPNWVKDSFFKAFREEYKRKLYLLNNTLLHPDNLTALGFGSVRNYANQRFASVNQQCGFGPFQRPNKPVNTVPAGGSTALPPLSLQASSYGHSASPAAPHASTTWQIRSANGTYRTPVFKWTSSTNLTSLPVPFESLDFGETYYWQVIYTDAQGHPSIASDETAFTFGPAPSIRVLIGIDAATPWRYHQNFTANPPPNWISIAYDDSNWSSGPPLLAVENSSLPEPIRTPLTLGRITYYFRRKFNLPAPPAGVSLNLRHVIDDGLIVYLNGVEVLRNGLPGGPISYGTLANRTVGNAVYEGPFAIPAAALLEGENLIAVEVHQVAGNSSDIVFGLELEGTIPAVSGTIVLNEIAADNKGSVVNAGKAPDWIELFNNGSQAIDLGGMSLSDDVLDPNKFVFPPGTLIAAQGYLVVWCDNETNAPGLHTGFRLNDKGQTVALFEPTPEGTVVRDFVTFGLQLPDRTIGRVANGTGPWSLTVPTPGNSNQAQATAAPGQLKINEWMAAPASGDDWFELYNPSALPVPLGGLYLTDDLTVRTNSRVPPRSFIDGSGFVQFIADGNAENGADHVTFRLSAGGESIGLYAADGSALIDTVTFAAQSPDVSQGRLPDGSPQTAAFPATASPGNSNYLPLDSVVINEVLTHSDPPLEDAIELHNPGPAALEVSGWFLSDDQRNFKKFRIPNGTIISPGGYHVFYEFEFNPDTNSPASFALSSAAGDDVYLSAADTSGNLTGYRAHAAFGPAENGVSFGRYRTSAGVDFTALSRRTFGADNPVSLEAFRNGNGLANAPPRVGPVVINEIMYHPPDLGTNDNTRDEFIELLNISASSVPLFAPANAARTWQLRDAVEFVFPSNVTLAPGQAILVVSFDPATQAAALAEFRAAYALSTSVAIYGPYAGRLANSRDRIELAKPDATPEPGRDPDLVPYILVDAVEYSDAAPWPVAADGTGPSLQRGVAAAYGNDPLNWIAGQPSPGRPGGDSIDSDGDGLPDAWELAHGLDPNANDAHQDPDQDSHSNLQEYLAGTHPRDSTSNLRAEIIGNGAGLALRFIAMPGHDYSVEWSGNIDGGAWQKLADVPPAPGIQTVEIPIPATAGTRFYRVRTPRL